MGEVSSLQEDFVRSGGFQLDAICQRGSGAWPIGREIAHRKHGKNDIVFLFVKLEDELDSGELIDRAEVDRGGGTEKIHGFQADASPGTNVLEVKAGCLLLKQNSHFLSAERLN